MENSWNVQFPLWLALWNLWLQMIAQAWKAHGTRWQRRQPKAMSWPNSTHHQHYCQKNQHANEPGTTTSTSYGPARKHIPLVGINSDTMANMRNDAGCSTIVLSKSGVRISSGSKERIWITETTLLEHSATQRTIPTTIVMCKKLSCYKAHLLAPRHRRSHP
jgi:hypothetical protein